MLVFRQLFDPASSTYTYLLADGRSGAAVIIDPVFEQVRRDAALIEELGLRLTYSLETHVHADHVSGAWMLKRRTGCRIAVSATGGAEGADRYLVPDDIVAFGERNLQVRATPGHTSGCLTYVLDDRSMAFTGDCLLVRGSGRTDFQEGDPGSMYRSVRQQIFSLPDSCLLYPARDRPGCCRRPALGPAQIYLCRHLGDRPARPRGACRGGADPRCARAGRVRGPARPHSRRQTDPARRACRARRRARARPSDRR